MSDQVGSLKHPLHYRRLITGLFSHLGCVTPILTEETRIKVVMDQVGPSAPRFCGALSKASPCCWSLEGGKASNSLILSFIA